MAASWRWRRATAENYPRRARKRPTIFGCTPALRNSTASIFGSMRRQCVYCGFNTHNTPPSRVAAQSNGIFSLPFAERWPQFCFSSLARDRQAKDSLHYVQVATMRRSVRQLVARAHSAGLPDGLIAGNLDIVFVVIASCTCRSNRPNFSGALHRPHEPPQWTNRYRSRHTFRNLADTETTRRISSQK